MGITRLYTADIYVHDLDKAVDFYVNKLGFEKRADEPVDEEGHRWVEVAPNGSETALVLSHGFGSWSPEKVGGWCRLIFRVEDMAGTVEALKAEGVAPTRRSGTRTATSLGCSRKHAGERHLAPRARYASTPPNRARAQPRRARTER